MSSGFTLEPRDGYLYVHLAPGFEMTPDSTAAVWIAICEACRERGLRRALAEGDGVTRRLTPMESFDIAGLAARLLPGLSVACVFRGYVPDAQSAVLPHGGHEPGRAHGILPGPERGSPLARGREPAAGLEWPPHVRHRRSGR